MRLTQTKVNGTWLRAAELEWRRGAKCPDGYDIRQGIRLMVSESGKVMFRLRTGRMAWEDDGMLIRHPDRISGYDTFADAAAAADAIYAEYGLDPSLI